MTNSHGNSFHPTVSNSSPTSSIVTAASVHTPYSLQSADTQGQSSWAIVKQEPVLTEEQQIDFEKFLENDADKLLAGDQARMNFNRNQKALASNSQSITNSTWWRSELPAVTNISNNNNTGTQESSFVDSSNNWSDGMKRTRKVDSRMDQPCYQQTTWSRNDTSSVSRPYSSSDVQFAWYDGGDYEIDILRAAATAASVESNKSSFQETTDFSTYHLDMINAVSRVDEDLNFNDHRDQNPTYCSLHTLTDKKRLPPISQLSNRAEVRTNIEVGPEMNSSLSPSTCSSLSPNHSALSASDSFLLTENAVPSAFARTGELSQGASKGANGFHGGEFTPYSGAFDLSLGAVTSPTNLAGKPNAKKNNDVRNSFLHDGLQEDNYDQISNGFDGNSEPIHRLKSARHKVTQRRLINALYQKNSIGR